MPSYQLTRERKLALLAVCLVFVFIAILFVLSVVGVIKPENYAFKPYMSQYVSGWTPSTGGNDSEAQSMYVVGRVIAVDPRKKEIDPVYSALPDELKAKTPSDVGTIVWVDCQERVVDHYTNGWEAYQTFCHLTLKDSEGNTLGAKSFSGSPPPGHTSAGMSQHGSGPPTKDMAKFIAGLPRR